MLYHVLVDLLHSSDLPLLSAAVLYHDWGTAAAAAAAAA